MIYDRILIKTQYKCDIITATENWNSSWFSTLNRKSKIYSEDTYQIEILNY